MIVMLPSRDPLPRTSTSTHGCTWNHSSSVSRFALIRLVRRTRIPTHLRLVPVRPQGGKGQASKTTICVKAIVVNTTGSTPSAVWNVLSEQILDQERESLGETFYRQEYGVEFVDAGAEGFIYVDWCEACAALLKIPDRAFPIDIGLDVARSVGGDKTVFAQVQDGVLIDLQASRQPDLMTTVGRAVQLIEKTRARSIRIDDSGLGGGVTDRLKELQSQSRLSPLWNCRVKPFNFGRKARYPKKYCDVRSEMWWNLGELLRESELKIPRNAGLIEQLLGPSMLQDSSGRMRLESKDSMRRRGISSPDLADALALACYPEGWLGSHGYARAIG